MINTNKVAVIGAGYWGKNLVRNFYGLEALGLIVDPSPVVHDRMAQDYPGVKLSDSYSEALSAPEIKGIAIATPAETHGNLIREAILAGKDVYVEKPLCLSENEGRELIQLATEKKQILMVGHLLWYHPVLLKLKELVRQGALGRIRYVYSNRLNMGKLRREENVLWSFAPHDVSVILGLLEEMPESVQAQGGNFLHQQIADVTVSMLSFASGVKAHIFVSWLHPFKEQKLVVVGDQKMAVFDDTVPWEEKLTLFAHQVEWLNNAPQALKAEGQTISVPQEEPLRVECAHFLECIATRNIPRTDGNEGLHVLQVLNACQQSLKTGRATAVSSNRQDSVDNSQSFFVHPTATVDKDVEIGAGTKIWHFSHVLQNSRIGGNCNIGQNVVVGPRCRIGNGCKIQNNISIYEGVTLEDYVFCGPSMVFTNVYNPRAEIRKMDQIRPTLVKHGATLGANCTIVCGITIGEYAFVGAGAVVVRNVPAYARMVGNPARQTGWMSRHGERLEFPVDGDGVAVCPVTGEQYRLQGTVCCWEGKNE
ncbi:MAG: Gfo/Idh/MocA family oxidoreductase [Sulfuricella sp.]|jgi:UDP-2-acetamido-3-amino-2,3-dideoxy-glucuronate N-acetyltransferase